MTTKTILGISLAAAFVVSTLGMAYANGSPFLDFDSDPVVEVKSNGNPNNANTRISVHIDAGGDVPLDNTAGPAFGWAIMTDKTPGNDGDEGLIPDNVEVLVTHLPIDDTAGEEDDSGLHTHVLDLKAAVDDGDDCLTNHSAPFEVDLPASVANKGFDLETDWSVDGDEIWIGNVPVKRINSADVDFVISFYVFPLPSDAETVGELDHLCVLPVNVVDYTE